VPLADVAGAAELGVRTVIRRPQAEILAPLMSGLSQKCFELNVIELETNRWLTRFEVGNFSKSQVIDARLRSAAFDLAASGDSLRGTQVIPARMLRTFCHSDVLGDLVSDTRLATNEQARSRSSSVCWRDNFRVPLWKTCPQGYLRAPSVTRKKQQRR
jgi:hypothetical protein